MDLPTQPFTFTLPGFQTTELGRGRGAGELWCRLRVTWPGYLATHSTEQMVYVGDDGLIGRHDYDLEIAGNSRGAHCISRYTQAAAS